MLSVIFATYNGEAKLKRTLDSLVEQSFSEEWQLIVVNNNSNDGSEQIIRSYLDKLPLTYLFESKPGKNTALNTALGFAKGEFYVFTDDDIKAEPNWLANISKTVKQNTDYAIFGGRIVPEWETPPPKWLLDWAPLGALYAVKEDFIEGECDPGKVWGPNMVVKAEVFKHLRFDENVGPDGTDCYPMGSETEFTKRAARRGYKSFSSKAFSVDHWVPSSSITLDWVLKRAMRLGAGVTLVNHTSYSAKLALASKAKQNLYQLLSNVFAKQQSKRLFWWKYKANYYFGCCNAMDKLRSSSNEAK